MARLTPRQKLFCDEYLVDLNAARAYKVTYKSCVKDETARVNSSKLLTKTNVKEYIGKRMKDRERRTEITQDMVMQELASIAFDDVKNYLSFYTDENGQVQIKLEDSKNINTKNIAEISLGKNGQFKFKLYGRDNALVQLGKHLGMFTDNLQISGNLDTEKSKLDEIIKQMRGDSNV